MNGLTILVDISRPTGLNLPNVRIYSLVMWALVDQYASIRLYFKGRDKLSQATFIRKNYEVT